MKTKLQFVFLLAVIVTSFTQTHDVALARRAYSTIDTYQAEHGVQYEVTETHRDRQKRHAKTSMHRRGQSQSGHSSRIKSPKPEDNSAIGNTGGKGGSSTTTGVNRGNTGPQNKSAQHPTISNGSTGQNSSTTGGNSSTNQGNNGAQSNIGIPTDTSSANGNIQSSTSAITTDRSSSFKPKLNLPPPDPRALEVPSAQFSAIPNPQMPPPPTSLGGFTASK